MGVLKMENKFSLSKKPLLVDNLLILDGITRAGKFFLGNSLAAIEGIGNYQYYGLFEHLPWLVRLNLIDKKTAKAIIECQIDNFCYDRMVGRNINFHIDDKSSIFNWPHMKDYLERCLGPDGDVVVDRFKKQEKYFPFIVHEVLPNIELFFEIYPKLKVIEIERNPIDLAYSWFKRGWGKRYGIDPKAFALVLDGKDGPVPWFAYDWIEEYETSSEIDRVIKSLYHINEMIKKTYAELSEEDKKKIHFLSYENLSAKMDEEIEKIAKFLGRKVLPEIGIIKEREKLPRGGIKLKREEKLEEIKRIASSEALSMLQDMVKDYDKKYTG